MLIYFPGDTIASTTISHASYGTWTTIATIPQSKGVPGATGIRVLIAATSTGGSGTLVRLRGLYTNYDGAGSFTASQMGIYEDFSLINDQTITTAVPGYIYADVSKVGDAQFPCSSIILQAIAYDVDAVVTANNATSVAISGSYKIISGS